MAKFSHILGVSSFAPDSGSFASLPTTRCTSSRNLKSKVGRLIIKRVQVIVSTLEEWFLVSGPRFNPSTMLLTGFVLGCPEFNSLAVLCRKPNDVPPASLDLKNTMFNRNVRNGCKASLVESQFIILAYKYIQNTYSFSLAIILFLMLLN